MRMFLNYYGIRCEPFRSDSEQLFSGKVVCPSQVCTVFSYHWGSVECRLSTDCGLFFLGQKTMGLLLSQTHLRGENNSPQSAFYTDCLIIMYVCG